MTARTDRAHSSFAINVPAWRDYARFYQGSRQALLFTILVSVGQSLLVLPIAMLVRYAFDTVIPNRDSGLLVLIGAGILLLYVANAGVTLWVRHRTLTLTKIVIRRLREELLAKLYTFSRSYYTDVDRGKLHASIVQDSERLDVMSNALVAQLLPAIVTSVALSAVLVILNWLLFLVMMGITPLLFLASARMGGRLRESIKTFYRSFQTFSKGTLFVLQMMDLTRIQSGERFELDRQKAHLEDLRLTSAATAWLSAALGLFQYTAVVSAGIIILIIGGLSVARGSMTLGQLLSFYVAFGLLGTYLQTIGGAVPLVIAGNQSLTTLFNILRAEDEAPYSGSTRIAFQGKVSLESVTFHYKDQPVLYDVSLTLRPGAIVAIVGPNGAGKSTIVNLILGFYRPQHGQLRADGHPYSELDLADLRRQMGVVMQDPIIFAGTILENITYGDPDLSAERVAAAARMATADEFIQGLPSGYETFVGEGGALLSGGQRQRIAIARALARQPRVLILDEPTNHLDRAAVRQVMANLRGIDTLPATLIISHDMDVIGDADIVYRLQEGRIVSSDPAAPAAAIVR